MNKWSTDMKEAMWQGDVLLADGNDIHAGFWDGEDFGWNIGNVEYDPTNWWPTAWLPLDTLPEPPPAVEDKLK